MSAPFGRDGHPLMPLIRCPRCASRLIAPSTRIVVDEDAERVAVDRRCPDCGHEDRVVTSALAAFVWQRHQTHHAHALVALADALAAGLPIEVSEISAT